jgi:hypothetical protein
VVIIKTLQARNLSDPSYYRAKIPAIGCYLKKEDQEVVQIQLF